MAKKVAEIPKDYEAGSKTIKVTTEQFWHPPFKPFKPTKMDKAFKPEPLLVRIVGKKK